VEFDKVFQSNGELFLNGEFWVEIAIMKAISGNGWRNKSYRAPETNMQRSARKRCVVTVNNNGKS